MDVKNNSIMDRDGHMNCYGHMNVANGCWTRNILDITEACW